MGQTNLLRRLVLKPKHQKVLILKKVKQKQPAKADWETHLKLEVEDYLREQNLLKNRNFGPTGGRKPSDSGPSLTFGSYGNNYPYGRSLDGRPVAKPQAGGIVVVPNFIRQLNLAERGAGGVMTDHAIVIPGERTVTETTTAFGVSETVTTVQRVPAYQHILQYVYSVPGDHKTPNRHSYESKRINYGSGSSYAGDILNNVQIVGTGAVGFGLTASFHDQSAFVYNKMLSKMYESIRGSVDLSIDAFQARQSGVMINQRFAQGRKLFTAKVPEAILAIGGIVKTLKRSNPRDWGSHWLEWVYGWKPLAADIYGAAENMINGSCARGHPIRAQAQEIGDRYTSSYTDGNGVQYTQVVLSKYQSRIVAFYALGGGDLDTLASYSSLNPVSIAWELVPYSFVVDWFVDVGGYLRNMESGLLYGSDFVSGYMSERAQESVNEFAGGGNDSFSVNAAGNADTRRFSRLVLSTSPLPRRPSFNPKLGTGRLFNAAALLSQQLHSLKHAKAKYEKTFR